MGKLITLPMQFNDKEYYLLIQPKKSPEWTDYNVLAITEDLQSKVYGRYIFREKFNSVYLISGAIEENGQPGLSEQINLTLHQYISSERNSQNK
ncbi:MAG: hypothetical protein JNK79_07380 [Chitinophagaceae bacterium]|nr:hypothetical protein [Chitinophagaceae bacterium]